MKPRTPVRIAIVVLLGLALLGAGAVYHGSHTKCRKGSAHCGRQGSGNHGSGTSRPKGGIYIAERTRGSGNGSNCADARGAAWFDNPADWGPRRGHIHAGTIVRLCGTISTPLSVHGGGAPGRPITVAWEPGATLSSTDWHGGDAVDTNGFGHLTFDGGEDGTVEATAEGTGLSGQGVASRAFYALGCNGCTFKNLTIKDLYVHTSTSDTSVDQTMDNGIVFSGSDITIADNTIHDVGWAVFARWGTGDHDNRIYGNDIYHIDHGLILTAAGTVGAMFVYRNHVHDMANWDAETSSGELPYHHDGLHCFGPEGGPAPIYGGLYIYDNRFDGTVGRAAPTAQIFMEGNFSSSGTPCAGLGSRVYIFNNVLGSTDYVTSNPYLQMSQAGGGVFNNTVVGVSNKISLGGCAGYGASVPGAMIAFENNVLSRCDVLMSESTTNTDGTYAAGSPDYDVYADGGINSFVCNTSFYAFAQFRSWRFCVNADRHSRRLASARLDERGAPERGSPVIGAGVNLTYLCKGPLVPLCTDIAGVRRPKRGPWNAGAY